MRNANTVREVIEAYKRDALEELTIISETMLINGIKYGGEFERIGSFLGNLKNLSMAYIAVPIRPPTEEWVKPARNDILNKAFQAFSRMLGVDRIKFLVEHEGNNFAFAGKIEDEILSIAAVHPIRREAMGKLLERAKSDWRIVEKLLQEGKLIKIEYNGNEYYKSHVTEGASL